MAQASEGYPPFKLGQPQFRQDTFYGRLRHFVQIIDPVTLFTTKKQLNNSLNLLRDFEKGNQLPAGTTDKDLWAAQKVKQAIIHPDTGEKIFMPFRMSGYVPFGSPMVVGLLLPNPSMGQIIFWQWLNQSHNALVNFSNRNATRETPTSRFLAGYFGAVTTAVSIGVGLKVFLTKANMKPSTRTFLQRFTPFPAVACANIFNVLLMRNSELTTGIEVTAESGEVVGTSQIAAKSAITSTAATRVFLPAPVFMLPPLIMSAIEKTKWLKRNPRMHLPVNAMVCTAAFAFGLPLAIALFPQFVKVKTSDLEPHIRAATKDEFLYYNKGL